MEIKFNSYQFPEFSALYPFPFLSKGILYKSIEHYYQYHKLSTDEVELRNKILNSFDPYKAKHFGSKKAGGTPKANFEKNKLAIMQRAIELSYGQNPMRQEFLRSTGNRKLIHEAEWDNYWGAYNGKGQNQFGILLMTYRKSL